MVFNVRKSVVALGVATSLLATSFLPTEAAFAANTETAVSSQRFQQLSASQSMLLNQTLSAGEIINPYIKVEDNLYKLDPAAADLVSKEVFETYSRGINVVNEAIKTKLVKIENGQLVSTGAPLQASPHGSISPDAFGGWYWWGINLYFTQQESKNLVYEVRTQGLYATTVFGLAGIVNPPAALVAILVNFGATAFANKVEYETTSNGVNIDISYVGTLNIYGK
ncbi:hypothetical protein [Paenibacillus tyrfis]|uniref:hypothetical protein n=1 Tax=Paenibacillus tyrfis TaxID=1501230 RepID=UPI000B58CADE|nr:hypothetical protein [Paenibacillus tyrfis]